MTIAVTTFEAYGLEIDEAVTKRFRQVIKMTVTGLNSDVTHDIGNAAGTFWGDADGTATGLAALAAFKDIATRAQAYAGFACAAIETKLQVTSLAAVTEYIKTFDATTFLPKFTFHTAGAPTAYTIILYVELKNNQAPVKAYIAA